MAAGSSDQVVCPPGNRHQVLEAVQPWYWTHPLGVTAWVWVPHLFRARYLSKKALPRLVRTKSSASPWKAMIGTAFVYFSVCGITPSLPEQGATARNTLNSKGR